ncbi:MAG: hypothetical protein D6728_18425 [Cyanobacteria bacterium J055]|nr:MAG: hypothetical protein D6728_18425 [Cyanobacteria bacterium J055]
MALSDGLAFVHLESGRRFFQFHKIKANTRDTVSSSLVTIGLLTELAIDWGIEQSTLLQVLIQ